jgi:hypothetical protein
MSSVQTHRADFITEDLQETPGAVVGWTEPAQRGTSPAPFRSQRGGAELHFPDYVGSSAPPLARLRMRTPVRERSAGLYHKLTATGGRGLSLGETGWRVGGLKL